MSEPSKDYVIVPSKINPKFGIVVPTVPYVKPKSMYASPEERRIQHIQNHRKGFEYTISKILPLTYKMKALHLFHYLQCEIPMKIRNEDHMGKSLVCDFPVIDDTVMITSVDDDEFLYASFLMHFQMHIMHKLLSFCEAEKIENLILDVERDYAKELTIYEDIVTFENPSNYNGGRSRMMIDVKTTTPEIWKQSLEIGINELQQEMWAEQPRNYTVREYLKLNPFVDLFC